MTKEIAHPPAVGDPGDEQPEVVFIAKDPKDQPLADVLTDLAHWGKKNFPELLEQAKAEYETPEWLKDNQCSFVKNDIRCILPEGHKTQHDYPNSPYCCYQRQVCWGRTSCPRQSACSE